MEALSLITKHRRTGALIDANVLLVYVVGSHDINCLAYFQHTKQYAYSFQLVKRLVEFFPVIYTTPHILTEVSNLGGKLGPAFFTSLLPVVQFCEETHCPSKDAVRNIGFQKLGLTDAAILSLASNQYLVVTADWPLYQVLCSQGIDAVNIYHLIHLDWLGALSS